MAERVFSIDLGNAYAKVGLRTGSRVNSEVLTDPALTTLDELRLCIPTTVAVDFTTTPAKFIFGDKALDVRPQRKVRLYSNWKKALYTEAAQSSPAAVVPAPPERRERIPSRLESLIRSTDFVEFAAGYGVSSREVDGLLGLFDTAAAVLATPNGEDLPPKSPADSDAFKIAVKFFKHLRQTVLGICQRTRPEVGNPETIPARLSVPAFAPESELPAHPGCRWMAEALRRAGWAPAAHRPIISEPCSNAIGIITRGSNCTRQRDMLQMGMLATCLANEKQHPDYRAVVIDVGAYTVDFAVLTYRTGGNAHTLDEVEFERQERSVALGVSELDSAVLGVIPHRQAAYLREQAPAFEWEDFRPRVYVERQYFPTPHGEVGSEGDASRIEGAIGAYTQKLAAEAREFFATIPDLPFKELILTGGGSMIPAVQSALISGAESVCERFRKIHLPRLPNIVQKRHGTPQQPIVPLEGRLTRGGTALGGSSFYFDMERDPYPLPKS